VQERQNNRWRALMDIEGPALEQVKARGASEIAASPVTLEDLFVGLIKGRSDVAAIA